MSFPHHQHLVEELIIEHFDTFAIAKIVVTITFTIVASIAPSIVVNIIFVVASTSTTIITFNPFSFDITVEEHSHELEHVMATIIAMKINLYFKKLLIIAILTFVTYYIVVVIIFCFLLV